MGTQEIVIALRATGLSQTEIARRTGIPQSRISRWQRGAVPSGANDALRLQALLADVRIAPELADEEPQEVRDAA